MLTYYLKVALNQRKDSIDRAASEEFAIGPDGGGKGKVRASLGSILRGHECLYKMSFHQAVAETLH